MPLDFVTINALARELNTLVQGAKTEKIFQPAKDGLTFALRKNGKGMVLYLSANPTCPVIHLTQAKFTNPESAPAFCMHLRKRLTHAIIDGIGTFNNDRIIKIDFVGKDEMFCETHYSLFFEMTGRYTNVILTRDGIITDALRHSAIGEADRTVLPGLKYEPAPMQNTPINDLEYVRRTLTAGVGNASEILLSHTAGLARSTADYLTRGFNLPASQSQIDAILQRLDGILSGKDFAPCVQNTGKKKDFFAVPYQGDYQAFDTLSSAVEYCTFERAKEEKRLARMRRITTAVKNALSRNEKKLAANQNKVLDGKNADSERIKAELITANIYRIKKGATELVCTDYYQGKEVQIPLDPTMSAQQNAQKLYARYAKLKRSVEKAEEQIAEIVQNTEYLNAIMDSASRAETESDFAEIETELALAGYLTDKKASTKRGDTLSRPIEYRFENVVVWVGKNNLQNDRLTLKTAVNSDLWFHVKGFHGSHVVARTGKEPTPALLHFCAELAAYYSAASASTKVEVDYTRIKNVKRHPSGRPGLVNYVDFKTITVKPHRHEDFIKKI